MELEHKILNYVLVSIFHAITINGDLSFFLSTKKCKKIYIICVIYSKSLQFKSSLFQWADNDCDCITNSVSWTSKSIRFCELNQKIWFKRMTQIGQSYFSVNNDSNFSLFLSVSYHMTSEDYIIHYNACILLFSPLGAWQPLSIFIFIILKRLARIFYKKSNVLCYSCTTP